MSLKLIKWLILLIPTITIGAWEYVRHEFLLLHLSMKTGNVLASIIVFTVTMLLITKLFSIMEKMQDKLKQVETTKAALQERENIARELHDGIAQSLFLLSVKIDQLESNKNHDAYEGLKKTIREVNVYVRQAIANLKFPPSPASAPWLDTLQQIVREIEETTSLKIELNWNIPASDLSSKDKVELAAIIREALVNVRKHANASHITIVGRKTDYGWICSILDDGHGFQENKLQLQNKYGLKIMSERANSIGWSFQLKRSGEQTMLEIVNEETK